jgi:hypothetical protein
VTDRRVSGNLILDWPAPMTDQTEAKKESVRTDPTPAPGARSPQPRDTVRITLPTRPPASTAAAPAVTQAPPSIAKALQPPLFVPPGAPNSSPSAPATPAAQRPASETTVGPKKETARVTAVPGPPPTSVQMKKTQPLIDMPAASPRSEVPVTVAPADVVMGGRVPIALCWTLVAVSAVILIIQILNYIS